MDDNLKHAVRVTELHRLINSSTLKMNMAKVHITDPRALPHIMADMATLAVDLPRIRQLLMYLSNSNAGNPPSLPEQHKFDGA